MLGRSAVGGHRRSVFSSRHGVARCRSAAAAVDGSRHPEASCHGHRPVQTLSSNRRGRHQQHRCHRALAPPPRRPPHRTATNILAMRPVNAKGAASRLPLEQKSENPFELRLAASSAVAPRHALNGHFSGSSSCFSSNSGAGGGADDGSFLLRMLGPRWSPYGRLARIDKPAGTLLSLFPCWWSIALAAPMGTLPDAKLMAVFTTGAVLMR